MSGLVFLAAAIVVFAAISQAVTNDRATSNSIGAVRPGTRKHHDDPQDGIERHRGRSRHHGVSLVSGGDTDTDPRPVARDPDADPRRHVGAPNFPTAASAATWAFVFLVLRIFAVSGYDWNTAFLVSTTIGLDDGLALVFGSLMAGHLMVSLVLVFLLPLLFAVCLWAPDGRRAVVMLPTVLGVIALIALTVSFGRWWLPLATTAVLVAFVLIQRLPAAHRLRRAVSVVMARVGWVSGIAVLIAAVLTRTPWVPLERIETTGGTVNGYVLSVDSGYLNVLTEEHDFVILISGDVLTRE